MRDIRVAAVQFQPEASNKAYNLDRVQDFVTDAAKSAVEIIAFPEMCLTGYWHVRNLTRDEVEALAEPVPDGPCTQELLRLSREHSMTIGAGLVERSSDRRVYNPLLRAMPQRRRGPHPHVRVFVSRLLSAGGRDTVFCPPPRPRPRGP